MRTPDLREWRYSETEEHKIYLWVEDEIYFRITKPKEPGSTWYAWVNNYCIHAKAKSVVHMIRRFRLKYPFLPIRHPPQNPLANL